MSQVKCYSELILLPTFEERLEYLRDVHKIGEDTFGFDRYLNQNFYKSPLWKRIRDQIIIRDDGCDLGIPGMTIFGKVYIHHIIPLTKEDILNNSPGMLDPENLICVSFDTHNAIHCGSEPRITTFAEREPNDTCPWKYLV